MKFNKLFAGLALALGLAAATPAMAVTDCTAHIWAIGSSANDYIVYLDDGSAHTASGVGFSIPFSDARLDMYTKLSSAGLVTQYNVIIRFTASGISCTGVAIRTDATEFWIANQ